ncbi:hypothetical protein SAY87_001252 [Trapa incisa]|uniref:CG-1 domain-containing protein n=1 Tax=Trapa incisa TaxID=236973 RepID=A0AAN7GGJ2_9MYRT|nr:hypothetical protein SAY87_001252 [Trapa incisa]
MAQRGSYGLSPQLDIQQLQVEAQHRWLRPAEICEILRNYHKFQISSEPPNRPPSGSLFLFDRKALRYFRKDGHNWRKKKDGKTVKEAHEKLKVGSVDVLHCYYAHGEENENFQRRSYWMLEQDQHIVFVHYLEIKGNRTNGDIIREQDDVSSSNHGSPLSHSSANHSVTPSGHTDSTSSTSTLVQLCEDADSGDIRRMSAGLNFMEPSQKLTAPEMDKVGIAALGTHISYPPPGNLENQRTYLGTGFASNGNMNIPKSTVDGFSSQNSFGLATWEEILRQSMAGSDGLSSNASISSNQPVITGSVGQDNLMLGDILGGDAAVKKQFGSSASFQPNWQPAGEISSLHTPGWSMDHSLDLDLGCEPHTGLLDQMKHNMDSHVRFDGPESFYGQPNQKKEPHDLGNLNAESFSTFHLNSGRDVSIDVDGSYSFAVRRLLKDGEESLKKVDSFSRWVSNELGEVESLQMQSSTGLNWSTDECETVIDDSSLSPSISQDQLFSIIDISPKWAYTDSKIQVLIVGTFLKNQGEASQCNWSCMFGEVEVPAQVLGDGFISCQAPVHSVGQVPFYVTCSNRLACSEVREFDYRAGSANSDISHVYGVSMDEIKFYTQLEKIFSLKFVEYLNISHEDSLEKQRIITKIIALKEENENLQILEDAPEYSPKNYNHVMEKVLRTLMEEKLYSWLIHKVVEDGKGPCILDDQGQGVLHLAAALGCDWAVRPILAAGVSINFRDVNGWTALHWAAWCGREQTVATLVVDCGAATGLLSDPSPEFPLGRTPADLASVNGHKGISGFLAESYLTSYVEQLTMAEPKEDATADVVGQKAFHTISGLSANPFGDGDLSLKDSLTAVCNATHAADRIHEVLRVQSFQRKQLEFSGNESELDGQALPLAAARNRTRLANSAAIQIQKKFRGWKKRKEFLSIRQRIVKIQAQWRGHQVRKQYRTIIWSVGILEKIILRWRRKGSGLRGYKSDAVNKDMSQKVLPQKYDDYDFLKEGRRQTEERLQKALTRVKSMVQYPEARAQYRRILNVCEGFREKKACGMILNRTEEAAEGDDDMIDIDSLLDDDSLMSMSFE